VSFAEPPIAWIERVSASARCLALRDAVAGLKG
jgi:hypothetical protein